MSELNSNYVSQIRKALYPRWQYTGGNLIIEVFDNGNRVVLTGYADPSDEERSEVVNKIINALGRKPEIIWERIGTQSPLISSSDKVTTQEKKFNESRPSMKTKSKSIQLPNILVNQETAKQEADQGVININNILNNVFIALQEKATKDINSCIEEYQKIIQVTNDQFEKMSEIVQKTHKDVEEESLKLLNEATYKTGKVITELQVNITGKWSIEFLKWVYSTTINSSQLQPEKAKKEVLNWQRELQNTSFVVDRIIYERAFRMCCVEVAGEMLEHIIDFADISTEKWLHDLGDQLSKLPITLFKVVPHLVKMCYQIALAYGFEEDDLSKQGELLIIIGIALSVHTVKELKLKLVDPAFLISPATNLMLFFIVGYTAKLYFEAKQSGINPAIATEAYNNIMSQTAIYLEEMKQKLIPEGQLESVPVFVHA